MKILKLQKTECTVIWPNWVKYDSHLHLFHLSIYQYILQVKSSIYSAKSNKTIMRLHLRPLFIIIVTVIIWTSISRKYHEKQVQNSMQATFQRHYRKRYLHILNGWQQFKSSFVQKAFIDYLWKLLLCPKSCFCVPKAKRNNKRINMKNTMITFS